MLTTNIPSYQESRVRYELESLLTTSHVVVVTEISDVWYNKLKSMIGYEMRHDEDDVAILWDPEVCHNVSCDWLHIYPDAVKSRKLMHATPTECVHSPWDGSRRHIYGLLK